MILFAGFQCSFNASDRACPLRNRRVSPRSERGRPKHRGLQPTNRSAFSPSSFFPRMLLRPPMITRLSTALHRPAIGAAGAALFGSRADARPFQRERCAYLGEGDRADGFLGRDQRTRRSPISGGARPRAAAESGFAGHLLLPDLRPATRYFYSVHLGAESRRPALAILRHRAGERNAWNNPFRFRFLRGQGWLAGRRNLGGYGSPHIGRSCAAARRQSLRKFPDR